MKTFIHHMRCPRLLNELIYLDVTQGQKYGTPSETQAHIVKSVRTRREDGYQIRVVFSLFQQQFFTTFFT